MKSVQIRTRKYSVFGHFSHSESSSVLRLKFELTFLLILYFHGLFKSEILIKNNPFSAYAKICAKLTFITPYTHTYVCILGRKGVGVRYVRFPENVEYILNGLSLTQKYGKAPYPRKKVSGKFQ